MLQLFILVVQIALAFYIVSTLYLVIVHLIVSGKKSSKAISNAKEDFTQKNIALVVNQFLGEEDLIRIIQNLNRLDYRNYTAYFFVNEPVVTYNGLPHVKVIRPSWGSFSKFELLELAKTFFEKKPEAVVVVGKDSEMAQDYLLKLNTHLCNQTLAVQSNLQVKDENTELSFYQKSARQYFNLIDREATQSVGLSAALWDQGFMLAWPLYHEIQFNSLNNEVKRLQAELISRGVQVAYDPEAILLQKALDSESFRRDKEAWLQSFLGNLQLGFKLLIDGARNPDANKILYGFNFMRPPLYILLLVSIVLMVISLFSPQISPIFTWVASPGLLISFLLLVKPIEPRQLIKALGLSILALSDNLNKEKKISYIEGKKSQAYDIS